MIQLVFVSPFVTLLRNEIRQFIFPKFTQFLNPSINVPVSTLKSLQKQCEKAKLWLEILSIINHIKELTGSFDLTVAAKCRPADQLQTSDSYIKA